MPVQMPPSAAAGPVHLPPKHICLSNCFPIQSWLQEEAERVNKRSAKAEREKEACRSEQWKDSNQGSHQVEVISHSGGYEDELCVFFQMSFRYIGFTNMIFYHCNWYANRECYWLIQELQDNQAAPPSHITSHVDILFCRDPCWYSAGAWFIVRYLRIMVMDLLSGIDDEEKVFKSSSLFLIRAFHWLF